MTATSPKPKTFWDNLKSFGIGLLLILFGIGLFFVVLLPYFSAWASGGTTWEAKDFAQTPPEDTIHFLTVKAMFGADSGFYEETRLNGIIPIGTDYFGVMLIDEETILVVKTGDTLPEFSTPTSFTGSLEEFESDVRGQVISEIEREIGSKVYPRMLDITEAENKVAWVFGGAVSIIMALVGVVMVLRGLGGMFSRAARPVERSI